MIQSHLNFLDTKDQNMIAYQISGNANGDAWKNILVIFNGNNTDKKINIPTGNWTLAADGNTINEKGIKQVSTGETTIPATSAYILYEKWYLDIGIGTIDIKLLIAHVMKLLHLNTLIIYLIING